MPDQPQPSVCPCCDPITGSGLTAHCTCGGGTGVDLNALRARVDLDHAEALANAATPGPWGHYEGDDYADVAVNYQATSRGSYTCLQQVARIEADWHFDDPRHSDCEDEDAANQAHADGAFIAWSRDGVPALVAEIHRLRAVADAAERVHTALHLLILADAPPGARTRSAWTALDGALIVYRADAQPAPAPSGA